MRRFDIVFLGCAGLTSRNTLEREAAGDDAMDSPRMEKRDYPNAAITRTQRQTMFSPKKLRSPQTYKSGIGMTLAVTVVVYALMASSCGLFKTEAKVESDTSWSGSFNGTTVEGTGNRTVDMGGGQGPKCASVQKQTRAGYLSVKIDGGDKKTTTAAFGVVLACN